MRILFVTNNSAFFKGQFGGAESSIRLLAEHLAHQGHCVHYLTKSKRGGIFPYLDTVVEDKINLHVYHPAYGFGRSRMVRLVNDYFFEKQLRSLQVEHEFEIAYCFYEIDILHALLRVADRYTKLRVVLRMAGMHWYDMCVRRPKLMPVYQMLFNRVHAVNHVAVGLAQMVDQKLKELGMDVHFKRQFVADIGCIVKPGRCKPYSKSIVNVFNIVMATRFSNYQKRQDILVKALQYIDEKYHVQVKFIGDGVRKKIIQELVAELGVSHRVEFIPFLPQEELWRELQESHLLCHACEYEGLSKIILESLALGLPVLVSDVPPLNIYIEEGINGFCVANDPQMWASKIEKLILNKAELNRVSGQSIEWVKQNHLPSENVKAYVKEFETIIGI